MSCTDHKDVTGYILAGGNSKRMGTDKRWIRIGQYSLLERTFQLLKDSLGDKPFVVCNDEKNIFPASWEIIPDKITGKGPLGGLLGVLDHCKSDWALILPVDLPLITSLEIDLLLNSTRNGFEIITLSESGEPEPLAALYNTSTLEFWTQRLQNNYLSLHRGIRSLKWKPVLVPAD